MVQERTSLRTAPPHGQCSRGPAVSTTRFDLDCPGFRLFSPGNRELQHTICQCRLNLIRIEVPRQRKLALKIANLVLLVDRAVALGRTFLDRRVNTQDPPVERDRQAIRLSTWHICQEHEPNAGLTNIHPRPKGSTRARALPALTLGGHFLPNLVRLRGLDLLPPRVLSHEDLLL